MTLLQCLQWLADNGYRRVHWPTHAVHSYESTAEFLGRETRCPSPGEFFIEVERDSDGALVARVYPYPRPPGFETDVSIAIRPEGGWIPPPEGAAWIEPPELYESGFLFTGHRCDDA